MALLLRPKRPLILLRNFLSKFPLAVTVNAVSFGTRNLKEAWLVNTCRSTNSACFATARPWSSRSMSTQSSSSSNCRQFYHAECEDAINKQINQELCASLVYLSMAYYFDRDDIALKGFHEFFIKSSKEETSHAEMLMKYQNLRGGRIVLQAVAKPAKDEWGGPSDAIRDALELEKTVNESLRKIYAIASKHQDYHLEKFMEDQLDEQVTAIKMLADYSTNLTRVGSGLGDYIFDKSEFPKS